MLRWGASYHTARVSDLVLVGPDGSLAGGEGTINIAGYYIHHPILEARPDLVSAVHVHTGWGSPFSAEARMIEPIFRNPVFFEDHALWNDEEVQVQVCLRGGESLALAQNSAIILRNHGLLTAGDSVAEAVGRFVYMERVAELHMKAHDPKPISAEAARFAKADLIRMGIGRQGFLSLLRRHIPDPDVVN